MKQVSLALNFCTNSQWNHNGKSPAGFRQEKKFIERNYTLLQFSERLTHEVPVNVTFEFNANVTSRKNKRHLGRCLMKTS